MDIKDDNILSGNTTSEDDTKKMDCGSQATPHYIKFMRGPNPSLIEKYTKTNHNLMSFSSACSLIQNTLKIKLQELKESSYDNNHIEKMAKLLLLRDIYRGKIDFHYLVSFKDDYFDFDNRLVEINFRDCYNDLTSSLSGSEIILDTLSNSNECFIGTKIDAESKETRYGEMRYSFIQYSEKNCNIATWNHTISSNNHYTPCSLFGLSNLPNLSTKNYTSPYEPPTPKTNGSSNVNKPSSSSRNIYSEDIPLDDVHTSIRLNHYICEDKIFSINHSSISYDGKFNVYNIKFQETCLPHITHRENCCFGAWEHFYMFLFCNGINISDKVENNFINILTQTDVSISLINYVNANRYIAHKIETAHEKAENFFNGLTVFEKTKINYLITILNEKKILEYFEKPYAIFEEDIQSQFPKNTIQYHDFTKIKNEWTEYLCSLDVDCDELKMWRTAMVLLNSNDESKEIDKLRKIWPETESKDKKDKKETNSKWLQAIKRKLCAFAKQNGLTAPNEFLNLKEINVSNQGISKSSDKKSEKPQKKNHNSKVAKKERKDYWQKRGYSIPAKNNK